MRDALAVILGYAAIPSNITGPGCDAAAVIMLPGCAPRHS